METLKEKIDLLDLSEDERRKLEEKFVASLAYVSTDEMRETLDVLAKKGARITKAREVKVLTNPASKIEKNYDFVEEAHELGIYSEDLNRLNGNGVDIFKRIRYCNQFDIPYKNDDGTYKNFIFNESLFQREVNGTPPTMETPIDDISLDDVEPIDIAVPDIEIPNDEVAVDEDHRDIQDYIHAEKDLDDIESQTTTFAQIKQDLEAQLAELDALRSQSEYENDNVYRFNDIEQETYEVGRGRAA